MTAIMMESLTKRYGHTLAVDDLSLEVEAGTVFGFLGRNGAGKTTTIKILLNLLSPTSGRTETLGMSPIGLVRSDLRSIECGRAHRFSEGDAAL